MSALIAFSTVSLPTMDAVRAFRAQHRGVTGEDTWFELSYECGDDFLRDAAELAGRVVSVHAPCPRPEYFPNLGSCDPDVVREGLESVGASARVARRFGGSLVVLHPGYTVDGRVPVDSERRIAAIANAGDELGSMVWTEEGICMPGYCETPGYLRHRDRADASLSQALRACEDEGVQLAVENLNPRVTYLYQLPGELVDLTRRLETLRLCVDLGHLWISSLVHGFGYLEGLGEILATGRVASLHVHDNSSRLGVSAASPDAGSPGPPVGSRFRDDHLEIGQGVVPLGRAMDLVRRAGGSPAALPRLVLETRVASLSSAEQLRRMLAAGD